MLQVDHLFSNILFDISKRMYPMILNIYALLIRLAYQFIYAQVKIDFRTSFSKRQERLSDTETSTNMNSNPSVIVFVLEKKLGNVLFIVV